MKPAVVVVAMLASVQAADAGRYCGAWETFAPGEGSTLPIGPTIAMHVEHAYFQGSVEHRAFPTKLKITLGGKPVKFTTKDVRVEDGLIRYITIKSKDTGELVITSAKKNEDGEIETFATYTIIEGWKAPEKPAVVVTHGRDARLDVYRQTGKFAKVRVEAPAISFSVKWRKNAKAKWRTTVVPAGLAGKLDWRSEVSKDKDAKPPPTAGFAEARIGDAVCGMEEYVPLDAVKAGIEIELTAKLPDGKTMRITELASPLVLPEGPKGRDDGLGID